MLNLLRNKIINIPKISKNEINTKIIEITGNPSSLKSLDKKKDFFGSASKIVFYNNEKVHLVGNAKMKYENMTISSEKIIFSPSTGFIESN